MKAGEELGSDGYHWEVMEQGSTGTGPYAKRISLVGVF